MNEIIYNEIKSNGFSSCLKGELAEEKHCVRLVILTWNGLKSVNQSGSTIQNTTIIYFSDEHNIYVYIYYIYCR